MPRVGHQASAPAEPGLAVVGGFAVRATECREVRTVRGVNACRIFTPTRITAGEGIAQAVRRQRVPAHADIALFVMRIAGRQAGGDPRIIIKQRERQAEGEVKARLFFTVPVPYPAGRQGIAGAADGVGIAHLIFARGLL